MVGAVVSGEQVIANVQGNLMANSVQDTSHHFGKQQSAGGSVKFGTGFSASANYSNSRASGEYASVTEQSGFQAGNSGFQLNVKATPTWRAP